MTLVFLALAAFAGTADRDACSFRSFPRPGSEWSSADGRKLEEGPFSWRHYKHPRTGDVVACVAWRTTGSSVDDAPVRQASVETITSTGFAYALTHRLERPIADTIRHRTVSIAVQNSAVDHKSVYRAIEYTYVYERAEGESKSAMAHGYVIAVGDFIIFIQHTAQRAITSDIAQTMAMDLAVEWSAKQASRPKGWSAGIARPDK